jgi:hypothetical protein
LIVEVLNPALSNAAIQMALKAAYQKVAKSRHEADSADVVVDSGNVVVQPLPAELRLEGGTPGVAVSGEAIDNRVNAVLADVRDAQLALYARTQYAFYAVFQALVLVLACAAVVALVVCIIRLSAGDHAAVELVADIGIGVSSLVTGGAATFIQTQASAAKDRYLEALKLLQA